MKKIDLKNIALLGVAFCFVAVISSCSKTTPEKKPTIVATSNDAEVYDFFPKKGLPNTVVKITGKNFKTGVTDINTVSLNGVPVPINAIKSDTITVTLPDNAISGAFTVRSGTSLVTTTNSFSVTTAYVSVLFTLTGYTFERISLDQNGNFYAFEGSYTANLGSFIYQISPTGIVAPYGSANDGNYQHIVDLVIGPSGDIYAANAATFNIIKFNISTPAITSVLAGNPAQGYDDGTGTNAKFFAISAITRDGVGNIYVADSHRVRKITSAGVVTTLAGNQVAGNMDGRGSNAQFGDLDGIAVDSEGNVYVTDTRYYTVRKIAPNGVVTTLAGNGVAGTKDGQGQVAQFMLPRGIIVDATDNIFVTDDDRANTTYKVRRINKLGLVSTFIAGYTDGPVKGGLANEATVYSAHGMTLDAAGNLYILSTGSTTVSKVVFQ